jgi:hypothetical protein
MFSTFTRLEGKLLLKSRKGGFIAAFFLLFFLLFFMYYSQEEPLTLQDEKRMETEMSYAIFYYLDIYRHDIPEVAEVYSRHTEIQSLLGMQVWHIGDGNDPEQYIEDGLEINRLRLEIHDLDHAGIPEHLVIPREEILKEDALLHYIRDNQLPIEPNSFATNHYVTSALAMMSGLLFLVLVLISANEIMLYENRHESLFRGMPLSFMKKVTSKVFVQAAFLFGLLFAGLGIGSLYLSYSTGEGGFSFPVLIYENGGYTAISTYQYLVFVFAGFALVIIVLLLLSVLLNMLFRHAFANILIGLGIFLLTDMVRAAGFQTSFLNSIKLIDIQAVLSGELAVTLDEPAIEFSSSFITLAVIAMILTFLIWAINKWTHQGVTRRETHASVK